MHFPFCVLKLNTKNAPAGFLKKSCFRYIKCPVFVLNSLRRESAVLFYEKRPLIICYAQFIGGFLATTRTECLLCKLVMRVSQENYVIYYQLQGIGICIITKIIDPS